MTLVHALSGSAPTSISSLEVLAEGSFRVVGPDPGVGFDVSGLGLAGRDAGIVSLDFRCEKKGEPPLLEVRWASAGNPEGDLTRVRFLGNDGRLLVPVDASPAWLLAAEVRSLRIDVVDAASCGALRIANVKLLQRHGAGPAPGS
jgi:hypothetical protein